MGALPLEHVISCERESIPVRCQHNLESHIGAKAKTNLAQGEVIFPHSTEAFIVKFHDRISVGEKSLAPAGKSFGVMEMENLHIGGNETAALDGREDLGESRKIGSGKNVLADKRIDWARCVGITNGMHQGDPVVGEEACQPAPSSTTTAMAPAATARLITARCSFIASILTSGMTMAAPTLRSGRAAPNR
jgi:hypothetical protein